MSFVAFLIAAAAMVAPKKGIAGVFSRRAKSVPMTTVSYQQGLDMLLGMGGDGALSCWVDSGVRVDVLRDGQHDGTVWLEADSSDYGFDLGALLSWGVSHEMNVRLRSVVSQGEVFQLSDDAALCSVYRVHFR